MKSMKTKRKGFTIVELVIVIAVIAVLAAVLIPTFSSIIKKANISSDTKMARNMTLILQAESADSPAPIGPKEAVDLLKANGIERLHPQTKFYGFYWIKSRNIVLLADEGDRVVYPEEMLGERFDADDWFDLTEQYAAATTTTEKEEETVEPPIEGEDPEPPAEDEETEPPKTFTVTVTCDKPERMQEFTGELTATEGEPYNAEIILAEGGQYWITKLTVYMNGQQYKTYHPEPGDNAQISIPNVTGNIKINISIREYCNFEFVGKGNGIQTEGILVICEKNIGFLFDREDFENRILNEGDTVASVEIEMGGKVIDVYDPVKQEIHISSVTDNVKITITTEKKQ